MTNTESEADSDIATYIVRHIIRLFAAADEAGDNDIHGIEQAVFEQARDFIMKFLEIAKDRGAELERRRRDSGSPSAN